MGGCIRQEDTIARLGGDEFTVLLPGIVKEDDAATIAAKILEAVRLPFFIEHRELFITTSIGVTLYPADGADPETLVRNADTAMYRAKERGRDNYQLYAPAMNSRALERLSLENGCARPSRTGSSSFTTSPWSSSRPGRSAAPKRSCAGSTRSWAW